MFQFTINEVTNLPESNFTAEVISIASKSLTNKNGKEYFPCTIKFVDVDAAEQQVSAMIYKANLDKGMEIGNKYRSKVIIMPDGNPLITVSHLTEAARANANMFGYVPESVK